jgi:hypothetical protein
MNYPEIMPLKRHEPALDYGQEYVVQRPDGTSLRKKLGDISTEEAIRADIPGYYRPDHEADLQHPSDVFRQQMRQLLGTGFTSTAVANHHWDTATDRKTGHINMDRLHEQALAENEGRDKIESILSSTADQPELFDYLKSTVEEITYVAEECEARPFSELESSLKWAVLLHQNPEAIEDGVTPLRLAQEERYWMPVMEGWRQGLVSYPEQVRNFDNRDIGPASYQMPLWEVVEFCDATQAKRQLTWASESPESRNYTSEEVTDRFEDEYNKLIRSIDHTPRQVIDHTMQWLTHEEIDSEGRVSLGLLRIIQEELAKTRKLLTAIQNGTYAEEFAQADKDTE